MDEQQSVKHEIRQSALRLLEFTTRICNERKRPGLIAFFKDDIINLTEDAKMLCSLLRLYNTFRSFEPLVLVQLNEFLPQDLRYIVTERRGEETPHLHVDLPVLLEDHEESCQKSHEIPEEDEFDVYLVSLSELVDSETATEFKQLLTKFVTGSNADRLEETERIERPERSERVEVLQFILRSAELLGGFPELLGGLLEYLNKEWYEYAIEQLKFENLEQIALAYQVFSENAKPIDLFKRVVKQYKSGKLSQTSLSWRSRVIGEIQSEIKRVAGVSDSLMQQFKLEKEEKGRETQEFIKLEHLQSQPPRIEVDVYDPFKRELKALVDVLTEPLEEPENPRPIGEITTNILDFYAQKRWREVNLAFGVPVHRDVLCELAEIMEKSMCNATKDNPAIEFSYTESFESSLLERAFLHEMEQFTSKNQLHLDDCEQFNNLQQFEQFCRLVMKKRPDLTYMQFKFACTERLNQLELKRLRQYAGVYSCENMIHDTLFCNSEKMTCYNSTIFKPIMPFDEKRPDLFYYQCDIPPLEHFTAFEKNLYNMTLVQKAKYCELMGINTNNNETENGYTFRHPVNIQLSNEGSCLNKDVYSSFANGYEAARANSANPYLIHQLEIETDRVFHDYEEPAALEEHMMKYDIFLANLKLTAEKLAGYCRCACPRLCALITGGIDDMSSGSTDVTPASGQTVSVQMSKESEPTGSINGQLQEVQAGESAQIAEVANEPSELAPSNTETTDATQLPIFANTTNATSTSVPAPDGAGFRICSPEEIRSALLEDLQQFSEPIQLILPETCQILLKSTLGDEYFDNIFLYTRVAAPYALRRVQELFNDISKHRNLIISPTFSRRVKQCYFRSLDFAGRAFLECDKKLLGQRIFLQELESRKQTAVVLRADNIHMIDGQLKPVYPWEFDFYGLPGWFYYRAWPELDEVVNPGASGRDFLSSSGFLRLDYIKYIVLEFRFGGCKGLSHGIAAQAAKAPVGENGRDLDGAEEIETSTNFIEPQAGEISGEARGGGEAGDSLGDFYSKFVITARSAQRQHCCGDIHSLMLPTREIRPEAYALASEVLNIEEEAILAEILRRLSENGALLLDTTMYFLVRLMLVLLDRLSFLIHIIGDGQHSANLKAEIDGSVVAPVEGTSYAQNAARESICSEIGQLTEPEIVIRPEKHLRGTELLAFLLVNGAPEDSFFAAFGMHAYVALGFKGLTRQIRRLADDIQEAAIGIAAALTQEGTGLALTPQGLAGFLAHYQLHREVPLIGDRIVVEDVLRSVPGCEVYLFERIPNWCGFSELDS